MLLSFLLVVRPRRRSLPPPHLAGPRGARRQAAARRGSVGFVCSESVSSSGHGALIVPRGTDTFPLLSDHRRHSGGDDVTHSANGKHVTPPGQSEHRTPGLGGWCDLGQVTPSELRLRRGERKRFGWAWAPGLRAEFSLSTRRGWRTGPTGTTGPARAHHRPRERGRVTRPLSAQLSQQQMGHREFCH